MEQDNLIDVLISRLQGAVDPYSKGPGGTIVTTKDRDGNIEIITRQTEAGQILETIWKR